MALKGKKRTTYYRGKEARPLPSWLKVDKKDVSIVSKYTWHIDSTGYVRTAVSIGHQRQDKILLHQSTSWAVAQGL